MIIINLDGGLGNQMFQYALYTKLKLLGVRVLLDTSRITEQMQSINRCTIFDAFVLDQECYKKKYICQKKQHLFRLLRRVCKKYFEKERGVFDSTVLDLRMAYLDGYWQTEKYFFDCREKLLEKFILKNELNEENLRILSKIRNVDNSVSVHLRLGDYSTEENQKIYGNICTMEYYEKAIAYYEEKYTCPHFFVFSNDSFSAKKVFDKHNVTIVDINDEKSGWADMYLMSQCKHNIIANSTFSWWGAWLNNNPQREVIAPKKWINTKEMRDICPKNWMRL